MHSTHLPYIPICECSHNHAEVEGKGGKPTKFRCPDCKNELTGQQLKDFHREADQHYTKALQDRQKHMKTRTMSPFPNEIALFQLPFFGKNNHGFYTIYGGLLDM